MQSDNLKQKIDNVGTINNAVDLDVGQKELEEIQKTGGQQKVEEPKTSSFGGGGGAFGGFKIGQAAEAPQNGGLTNLGISNQNINNPNKQSAFGGGGSAFGGFSMGGAKPPTPAPV